MTSYAETDSNNMELSLMPTQFLNVVINESQNNNSNSKKKNETLATILSMSKSAKRALESETTIIPIYTNSK